MLCRKGVLCLFCGVRVSCDLFNAYPYMLCVATRLEDNYKEEWSRIKLDWQRCVDSGCGCVMCALLFVCFLFHLCVCLKTKRMKAAT